MNYSTTSHHIAISHSEYAGIVIHKFTHTHYLCVDIIPLLA